MITPSTTSTKRPGRCWNTAEPVFPANPPKESPMNVMEDTTTTADVPQAIEFTINREALTQIPRCELLALASATRTLLEVANAMQCQPRFGNEFGYANAGGEVLDELAVAIGFLRDAAFDAACTGKTA
ncbi:hypothetical protein [Consotaella aegiceratis]|uniref:hypothetical protein n=1 Tax=Consotaella aegiceratis TaxID=3097961 RepID=UPI002F40B9AA